jgi:hypothetical protein
MNITVSIVAGLGAAVLAYTTAHAILT